jgi:hypothetical protein
MNRHSPSPRNHKGDVDVSEATFEELQRHNTIRARGNGNAVGRVEREDSASTFGASEQDSFWDLVWVNKKHLYCEGGRVRPGRRDICVVASREA